MNRYGLLTAEDIECRAQQVSAKGVSLLLYKNARVDAQKLDEVDGSENWQCRFYECKGTLFCSLGVKHGDEWVWKDDAGAPSNMDSQKGEASDAFKRAGFKHGIGRELYSAPFVYIFADQCKIEASGQRYVCKDNFEVTEIAYDHKERICRLVISKVKNGRGTVVYTWEGSITPDMVKTLATVSKAHGYTEEQICGHFNVSNFNELTAAQFMKLMDSMGERA